MAPLTQQTRRGLLDADGQIHTWVEGTVEMVGPRRGKGADHLLVVPIELHVDRWRVGLFQRLSSIVCMAPPSVPSVTVRFANVVSPFNFLLMRS